MRVILTFILASACLLSYGQSFTNKGKEFWVGYGHNALFYANNAQDMVLYLSAEQPAHVTVSISNTTWVRNYTVAAGQVVVSDLIPKNGAEDPRLVGEGISKKNIHIESDAPIVAYAHVFGQYSSGAAMLLPVQTYGYTYVSCNTNQSYGDGTANSHSWFYVVAAENNTRVRITPSMTTASGVLRNQAFEVALNKGEIVNVMGSTLTTGIGNDMSGSTILSIAGADGKCHPISVFSGSSRTEICPGGGQLGPSGDFIMQQVFPATAWGARYLTGITANTDDINTPGVNRFRVYVRDKTTKVFANGSPVPGSLNPYGNYYDFSASTPQYITADKPVMVAQLIVSQGGCGTSSTSYNDPEMIFLSPMEQAINNVSFYSAEKENILNNYLMLTIPAAGINSLSIDGSAPGAGTALDLVIDCPGLPGYKVVVKELSKTGAQHNVRSDSVFNAIAYGLGDHESYGYNAGSYVNNLTYLAEIKNDSSATANSYTCPNTPFTVTVKTLYNVTGIVWNYGLLAGFQPSGNIVYSNPVPDGTEVIDGKTYNIYKQPLPAQAPGTGTYYVPITVTSPSIDNCTNSENIYVEVDVLPGPTADFTAVPDCATKTSAFTASSADPLIDKWRWDFGDKTTDNVSQPNKIYAAGGSYTVNMWAFRSSDGCAGMATKTVSIPATPKVAFDAPAVVCMPYGTADLVNKTTVPGTFSGTLQYGWNFGDGGTAADKSPTHYYVARGSYPVKLVVTTNQGCADSLTTTITNFADRPVAGIGVSNPEQCTGTSFGFTDKSTYPGNATGASYKWTYGDGTTGTTANPAKTYKQAGSYTVTMAVTSSDGCISDTASTVVKIHATPVVDAGPDLITEPGKAVLLNATVTPATATVTWSPPTNLSNPGQLQPMASPVETTRYYITATGEMGCTATDSMLLKVFKELKVPNAFTPNGDGKNDTWRIPGLEDYKNATVQVFNRWGQIVFKSTGYSNPWRGDINGTPLPTGAYYYVIQTKEGDHGTITGMVMIVR
ncbi:PKD domain containing protein [Niastella koreensis GR20-10]|uniref:PKD domain containing protein n=1 Tax=Niastella koreensis (strain DSM 17620 / KACC 11465 / NBRC 106392 / GR20-10) TaxID=700598 RepID=G8TQW7_NIAKG|nr:PKD domain containing protein [Niastella koreensis GR20-10]